MNALEIISSGILGVIIVFSEIFSKTVLSNIFLSFGLVAILLLSMIFILKKYVKASNFEVVKFLLAFSFMLVYVLVRYTASAFKIQLETQFSLTSNEFSKFSSYFSLGYAAFQIIAGYIIGRWNLLGLSGLNFLAGISLIFTTLIGNYNHILIFRILSGILFSAGSLGLMWATNGFGTKWFNLLFSFGFFVALKLASMINFFLERKIEENLFAWTQVYKILGIFAIVIGSVMFLLSFKKSKILQSQPLNKNTDQIEEISFFQTVKSFFTSTNMLLLAIYSALIIAPTYVFHNGWLNVFDKFSNKNNGESTKIFNDTTAYASIIIPIFVSKFGVKPILMLGGYSGLVSSLILLFFAKFKLGFSFIFIASIFNAIAYISHSVPNVFISETITGKKASMYFAIINFCCMIIGSSFMQQISGYILELYNQKQSSNNFTLTNLNPLLVFLTCCSLASFVCSIIFFLKNRKSKKIA